MPSAAVDVHVYDVCLRRRSHCLFNAMSFFLTLDEGPYPIPCTVATAYASVVFGLGDRGGLTVVIL